MIDMLRDAAIAINESAAMSLTVKATVILTTALVAARMARGSRASARHLLLAASFAALLLLPAAAVWLPAVTVHVPVEQAALTGSLPPALTDDASVTPGITAPEHVVSEPARAGDQPNGWMAIVTSNPLLALWIAGGLIFLVPVLAGLWQMRRLRRDGLPWLRAGALADEIAQKAGIGRHVDILCHEAIAAPMTCGILRPVILLPRDARAWRDDNLRRALTHELAHIRRADWLVLILARTVCACYWFHPLVWIAWRQLRLEAERASDDVVLRGAEPTRYAELGTAPGSHYRSGTGDSPPVPTDTARSAGAASEAQAQMPAPRLSCQERRRGQSPVPVDIPANRRTYLSGTR